MNRNQRKRLFQALLAVGIVLLVLSVVLDGRVPDALGGMLCGMAPACWPWPGPPC